MDAVRGDPAWSPAAYEDDPPPQDQAVAFHICQSAIGRSLFDRGVPAALPSSHLASGVPELGFEGQAQPLEWTEARPAG